MNERNGTRGQELANFLTTRRRRILPEEVGFAMSERRRLAGLRREEVAVLAGISLTWYTALEHGKDTRVSEQLLESLVRTLRLDDVERNVKRSTEEERRVAVSKRIYRAKLFSS